MMIMMMTMLTYVLASIDNELVFLHRIHNKQSNTYIHSNDQKIIPGYFGAGAPRARPGLDNLSTILIEH